MSVYEEIARRSVEVMTDLLQNQYTTRDKMIEAEVKTVRPRVWESATEFYVYDCDPVHITEIPDDWLISVISGHCSHLGLSVERLQMVQKFSLGSLGRLVQFIYAIGDTVKLHPELLRKAVLLKVLDQRWEEFGRYRISAAWVKRNVGQSGYIPWSSAGIFEYTKFNEYGDVTEVMHRPTSTSLSIDPQIMRVRSLMPPTTVAIGDNYSDLDAYVFAPLMPGGHGGGSGSVASRPPRLVKIHWIVVFACYSKIWGRLVEPCYSELGALPMKRPELLGVQELSILRHPSTMNWAWWQGRMVLSDLSYDMMCAQGLKWVVARSLGPFAQENEESIAKAAHEERELERIVFDLNREARSATCALVEAKTRSV